VRKRIGLYGGTFNPVHRGHVKAAEDVRTAFRLDTVLFIPSYIPPHKESAGIASAADRFRMVELACRGHKSFVPSPVEVEARETSYSIVTLTKIKELNPGAWIFFIVGADAFLEIETWREHERVLAECLFIVTGRPGFDLESAADVLGGRFRERVHRIPEGGAADESVFSRFGIFLLPIKALDISATDIRNRVRRGESLEGLVPDAVAAYIREHQLYTGR
jgi:nicotinate-nucleotide adenylyltransferase